MSWITGKRKLSVWFHETGQNCVKQMIWTIIGLSILLGYCLANAAYYSDQLAHIAKKRGSLGPYAGWKPENKLKEK